MPGFTLRLAVPDDIPQLRILIEASVRGLQADDYSPEQIEGALRSVFGVDTQLIADGTYFVAQSGEAIAGCGGWSKRKTLYGGDQFHGRADELLDPVTEAAKIRAFFVHPDYARQGIGSAILDACEQAAAASGFARFEMGATLTGVPLYRVRGYVATENIEVPLANGLTLPVIRMEKIAGGRISIRAVL
jgi:GNAT superfamily N-acetyltransferase